MIKKGNFCKDIIVRIPVPVINSPRISKRGLSATYLMLLWSTFGGLILFAFNSNFLSMLVSPIMERPLDSAKDILEQGLIPITKSGGWYENLLQKHKTQTFLF